MSKIELAAQSAYKPRLYKTAEFAVTATIELPDKSDPVRVARIHEKVQPIMAAQIKQYEDAAKALDDGLLKRLRELRKLKEANKAKEYETKKKDIEDFAKYYEKVMVQYREACERRLKKTIDEILATEAKEAKEATVTNIKTTVNAVLKFGSSVLLALVGAGAAAGGIGATVATAGAGSVAGVSAIASGSIAIFIAAINGIKGISSALMGLMKSEMELRDQVEDAIDDLDTKVRKQARHARHGTQPERTTLQKVADVFQKDDTKTLKDLVQRHKAKLVGVRQNADALGKRLVEVLDSSAAVEKDMTKLAKEREKGNDAGKTVDMKKLLKDLVENRKKATRLLERIPKVSERLAEGIAVDDKAAQWVAKAQKTLPSSGPGLKLGHLGEPLQEVISSTADFVKNGLDITVALASLKK